MIMPAAYDQAVAMLPARWIGVHFFLTNSQLGEDAVRGSDACTCSLPGESHLL